MTRMNKTMQPSLTITVTRARTRQQEKISSVREDRSSDRASSPRHSSSSPAPSCTHTHRNTHTHTHTQRNTHRERKEKNTERKSTHTENTQTHKENTHTNTIKKVIKFLVFTLFLMRKRNKTVYCYICSETEKWSKYTSFVKDEKQNLAASLPKFDRRWQSWVSDTFLHTHSYFYLNYSSTEQPTYSFNSNR